MPPFGQIIIGGMLKRWPEQVTQNDSGAYLEQNAINKCMSKNAQYIAIQRLLH